MKKLDNKIMALVNKTSNFSQEELEQLSMSLYLINKEAKSWGHDRNYNTILYKVKSTMLRLLYETGYINIIGIHTLYDNHKAILVKITGCSHTFHTPMSNWELEEFTKDNMQYLGEMNGPVSSQVDTNKCNINFDTALQYITKAYHKLMVLDTIEDIVKYSPKYMWNYVFKNTPDNIYDRAHHIQEINNALETLHNVQEGTDNYLVTYYHRLYNSKWGFHVGEISQKTERIILTKPAPGEDAYYYSVGEEYPMTIYTINGIEYDEYTIIPLLQQRYIKYLEHKINTLLKKII